MRPSSSSSVSRQPMKRKKSDQKPPVRKSPFTDFETYMTEKNRKLRSQFEAEASTSSLGISESSPAAEDGGIFNGVSIFVNGHTIPSSQELRGYMLRHGGRVENYFSRQRVTHIICSNLADSKMRNLRAFSRGLPVVKPEWVVDSVASNKLLSCTPYQFFEHSSETYKQQKLSAFFGCKSISCFKDTDNTMDSNVGIDSEGSEKSMDSPLGLQNNCLKQKLTNSLDEVNRFEASDSDSLNLSIQSTSHLDYGSFGKSSNHKHMTSSDVHHSAVNDPNFVENYFKSSRLHFIGTWRNRYRKHFSNMLKGVDCVKKFVHPCSITKGSSIIHIDLDCFFVSVILRKYPDLLNKPVAVCHSDNSRGTAEISSANYPARDYGIRAGMFVRDAKACYHDLVVFPYDFEAYEEVADQFYSILHKHCNKVQAVSCDEAFVDITEYGDIDPESFTSFIRKEIVETTQCTASAGIAGNMLMARLATKSAKPNGQCFIPPEKVDDFLEELPVMTLPGIGHSLGEKLKAKELRTCGQLRMVSKVALRNDFGARIGDMLWNYCRGFDDRKVEILKEAKSVGADVNWGVRFENTMDCDHFLIELSKEVSSRLKECGVLARTINLKVKKRRKGAKEPVKYMGCGDCESMSRSITLPIATGDAVLIQRIAKQIFASFHIDVKEVRGVGLQMSRLESVGELNRQGQQHNVLESWFSLHSKKEDESVRLCNQISGAEFLTCEENLLHLQVSLLPHENSCIEKATALVTAKTAQCSSRPYESANAALPPVCHLDMSVINHLPAEIISEMNDAYKGKLYDFIGNQREHAKSGVKCTSLIDKYMHSNGERHSAMQGKMQLCSDTSTSDAGTKNEVRCSQLVSLLSADQMELAAGTSSNGFLYPFSDVDDLNRSTSMPGVFDYPSCSADHTRWIPPRNIESEIFEHSKVFLWSGNPPKWVEKFEASDCLILNVIAQLFTKSATKGLLSSVLQSLVPLYHLICGSSSEDPVDTVNYLSELLLHYISLKIDSDIEELYLCFRLLERLTSISNVFSQVYNMVLSPLQVSVSEKYGGKLQLGGNEGQLHKGITR